MPKVEDSWLVESGIFMVCRLSVEERAYVAKNVDKGKLHVEDHPPPPAANPRACFHALDVLSYYPDTHKIAVEKILASIGYEQKKDTRRKLYGRVDLENIGVGGGIGQTREERMFDFPLFDKASPEVGDDWAKEYRTKGSGPVVADPTKAQESRRIDCPWCEESYSGRRAVHAMSTHVGRMHKEHRNRWRGLAKEYRDDPLKGVEEGVAS